MKRRPVRIFQSEQNGIGYIQIDGGDIVICDTCGEDWTERPESGGLLFCSKAVCPNCATGLRKDAEQYEETHLIRGECPENMPFADWVRSLRK